MPQPQGLAQSLGVPHTPRVDQGQLRAAEAAEIRRAELALTQKGTGVDPKTWREFINGKKWPAEILTRSRIESFLDLKLGALERIAQGRSGLDQEVLRKDPAGPGAELVPPELDQMLVLLNEADPHYRSEQASLGDLKVETALRLGRRILDDRDERQAGTP